MNAKRNNSKRSRSADTRQILSILAVIAIALLGFFLFHPPSPALPSSSANLVWLDDLKGIEQLSSEKEREVAEFVFKTLFPKYPNDPPALSFEDQQPRMLFLSLSDGQSKAKVIFQTGTTLQEVLDGLLDQARALTAGGFSVRLAKLDILAGVFPEPTLDLSSPSELERSLYGLAFNENSGIALLPEVLVAETILDSSQEFRLQNLQNYFTESGQPADFAQNLSSFEQTLAYRFSSSAYFYENGQIIQLYRGHRSFPLITLDGLLQSAIAGGRYLTESVDTSGRFVYSYLPKSNRISDDYNILRHAGTTYAMLDLYAQTGDKDLLESAQRAIGYMMANVRLCPVGGRFENCLVEDGEAKLGGNGLAVLALTYYMRVTGDQALLGNAQSLARWMLSLQDESGEFVTHILDFATGEESDHNSLYYPGEAIYALANLYLIDGNEEWLRAARNGARWLANDRIKGYLPKDITHDHWLLLGLDVLQHISPDPVFYESAMTIADAIISAQNLTPAYPDWYGSYYIPPRSTPAATRSEGLVAAWRVARDFGTAQEAQRILDTVKDIVSFQLTTQFRPEKAMYLPDPQRVLGGFHRDLTNFEIRNDYVQHNISAILALYRALAVE